MEQKCRCGYGLGCGTAGEMMEKMTAFLHLIQRSNLINITAARTEGCDDSWFPPSPPLHVGIIVILSFVLQTFNNNLKLVEARARGTSRARF